MDVMAKRDRLRDAITKAMSDRKIDVLLTPAWATPAPQVEEARNHIWAVRTTRVFNFLDFPAGVVPVTLVTAADVAAPYEPRTDHAALAESVKKTVAGSEGLPIA